MTLIAIDLDGTLLNREHMISQTNKQAIETAAANGYEVAIATGRAHFDVKTILQEAGLQLYTIGANGATIHSPKGESISSITMPQTQTRKILEWIERQNLYYELLCANGIYTPENGRQILEAEMAALKPAVSASYYQFMVYELEKQMSQNGFVYMKNMEDVYQAEEVIHNILIYSFSEDKRTKALNRFKEEKGTSMVTSSRFNLELAHEDASKGQALLRLSDMLGKNLDRSMAIGDSGNDLSMFAEVSDSFVMENADEKIKPYARYMAASNDADGVAKAIKWFVQL